MKKANIKRCLTIFSVVLTLFLVLVPLDCVLATGTRVGADGAGVHPGSVRPSVISPTSYSFCSPWYHLWSKTGNDHALALGNDSTGNLYISGTSGANVFIAKYNTTRDVVWNRTRVSAISADITGMAVDAAGNIFIVGTLNHGGGNLSAYLAMYDTLGNSQWNRTWHKLTANTGYGVAADRYGSIYIAGDITDDWFFVDAFLAKYDMAGNSQWNRTWSKANYDGARAVAVDSSGNICITGISAGSPFVAKYLSSGTSAWNRTWYTAMGDDEGLSIAFDPLGNVYVGGWTNNWGSIDAFITKYSSAGVSQWNRTWNGENDERGYGVCADATGTYLVGATNSYGHGGSDAFVNKYDLEGNLVCNTTWGGSNDEVAWAVVIDGSGGVYVAGQTEGFGTTPVDQAFLSRLTVSWVPENPGNDSFPVEYTVAIIVVAGVAAAVLVFYLRRRAQRVKKPANK